MKLVFASDLVLGKDLSTDSFYNHEFNYADWQSYLDAYDELFICSPVSHLPLHTEPDSANKMNGPRVSIYPLPPLNGPLSRINYRFEALRVLQKALQDGDVLIARLPSEIGLFAIQAAKLLNKPWAVEVVGSAEEYYDTSFGKLLTPFMNLRLQKVIGQAPAAMYVTNRFLQRRYPSSGRMIACSNIEVQPLSPRIATDRLDRISTCFERDVYFIGLKGTLSGYSKGIDTALRALKKVQQLTVKTVMLDIVGDGDASRWKRVAEELDIENFVHFKGSFATKASTYEWLEGLDLYIQPSRRESFPREMLEAMSRGLPVFGTRVGGISELLPPNQLMQPEDDNRLAMLICDLINDTTKQRHMAERSLEAASAYTANNLRVKKLEFFNYVKNHVVLGEGIRELVESNRFEY